jgi:hypothetical protein
MRRYDFKILSMWESRSGAKTEFVYLLEWPDQQVMADRWSAFMADSEWAKIKVASREAHGPLMGAIQDRVLVAAPYSPQLVAIPADTNRE